jgi:hypothetical protein
MNIQELRVFIAKKIGIFKAGFDGSAGAIGKLKPSEQEQLNDEVSFFIYSNPDQFTAAQVEIATRRVEGPLFRKPLETYSLAEMSRDFASGAKEGFDKNIAPQLSALGGGLQFIGKNALLIAVVVGVVVLLPIVSPSIGAAFREGKKLSKVIKSK